MTRLLLDADFLVALARQDDTNHKKAFALSKRLEKDALFISPFTIPEAATVLSYKVSRQSAKKFLEGVRQRNFIELVPDLDSAREADRIFLAQRTKGTSWMDCLNVALVGRYKLDGIISFDSFYKRFSIGITK